MTPNQSIKAGALALTRKQLRELFLMSGPATLTVTSGAEKKSVILDIHATRAALNGADLDLSNRLQKLGVSEQ